MIIGPVGTGKTYLCSALVDAMLDKVNSFRAHRERDIFSRLRMGIEDKSKGDYLGHLHALLDDHFCIIDDVGAQKHNEWRQEVLLEMVDYRYYSQRPTVFTSNLTKKEFLEIWGERITDRLFAKQNLMIDFSDMPNLREEGL